MGELSGELVLSHVGLVYERRGLQPFTALANVDARIEHGEFVTIVGPSGCGKSTLLSLIAGLAAPSSGCILVDGEPVGAPGPDRALVFQDFALLPWRTVLGNVELGLQLRGVARADRLATARSFVGLVGLHGFEHHYPHQLSGGMRQRVGIARALSVEPRVLLMDEPFGALDAQVRQIMGFELLHIWERARKTILFVTHDVDEAIYLADRVLVMGASPGSIIEDIRIELDRPRPLEIRNTRAFTSYRQAIWDLLEAQIRASGSWARAAVGA